MREAILVEGLRKAYANKPALTGLDLSVAQGTLCALLGPNGAGKTTAVRVLTTLLRADGGRAWVAGGDVAREPARVRARIGLVGQHAALDEVLGGRQNLELFGRLNHLGRSGAARRAAELLARFDLVEAAELPVEKYSGGMRRRLDLAAGLICRPRVLFLDEPTTGLDPRGRREVWDAVRALMAEGTTVLLTTQYLEEADELADDVVVLDGGRVAAQGSPARLKAGLGADRVDVVLPDADQVTRAAQVVDGLSVGPPSLDVEALRVSARVEGGDGVLLRVVRALDAAGLQPRDVTLRRPTLDEVFLHLTGAESVSADFFSAKSVSAGDDSEVRR